MNHTSGPWRIGDAGATIFGSPDGNPSPRTVATITRGASLTDQQRANASLISAAPELLALLERFYAQTYGEDINGRISLLDFEQARKAIAKAGGNVA